MARAMIMHVLLSLLIQPGEGEVIDRIAVRVGRTVITQSQIEEQIRVTAFLNGEEPSFSPSSRRRFAAGLVDVVLIGQEMEISRHPKPEIAEVTPMWGRMLSMIRESGRKLEDELERYGVSEEMVRRNLLLQLTTMRFITYRFRPGVAIGEDEVEEYYRDVFVADWRRKSDEEPPDIDEVREEIETILTERKLDDEIDRWLVEARSQIRVQYIDEAFQ